MTSYLVGSELESPRLGQYVYRMSYDPNLSSYIACIVAEREGKNGTIQYDLIVEGWYGGKHENITATKASDGTMHECPRWVCSQCESFTMCLCRQNESD